VTTRIGRGGWVRVWRSIASDTDFRALSVPAQWLYFTLLSSPATELCGRTEWHAGRLATRSASADRATVVAAGMELSEGRFIIIDTGTGEALIRTYVRHAEVLRNPFLAKSVRAGYERLMSDRLRGVLVWELRRMHVDNPTLHWGSLVDVLGMDAIDPGDLHSMFDSGTDPDDS